MQRYNIAVKKIDKSVKKIDISTKGMKSYIPHNQYFIDLAYPLV